MKRLLRAAALGLAAGLVPAASAASSVVLNLRETKTGHYVVQGSFLARASSGTAWDVLTDYEGLPAFLPSMKVSKVHERDGIRVFVEQESSGGVWFVRRSVLVFLYVREEEPFIRFEDRSGHSFDSYAGSWEVGESLGPEVEVTYRLHVLAKTRIPGLIVKSVIRGEIEDLLKRVRAEIERREKRS